MARQLSADDLMHGAVYALEQARLLLGDAVALYEQGRYSSAIVLAVFAREEIGRSDMLLKMRKKTLASGQLSLDDVKTACEKHVPKLREAMAATTTRLSAHHAPNVQPLFGGDPQTEEYEAARQFVKTAAKTQRRHDPDATHAKRMRALYVEPQETGPLWNRPCQATQDEACHLVVDVGNIYDNRRDRLRRSPALAAAVAKARVEERLAAGREADPEAEVAADLELLEALARWAECPQLADSVWPRNEFLTY